MPTTCDIPLYHHNYSVPTYYHYCDYYTTYCDTATTTTTSYTYPSPTSDPPTTTCGGSPLPSGRHHQPTEGGTGGYSPLWCQEEGCPGPRTTWRSPKAPSAPPGKGATWLPLAASLPGPGPILGAHCPGCGSAPPGCSSWPQEIGSAGIPPGKVPARGLRHLTPWVTPGDIIRHFYCYCPGLPPPKAPVIVICCCCLVMLTLENA